MQIITLINTAVSLYFRRFYQKGVSHSHNLHTVHIPISEAPNAISTGHGTASRYYITEDEALKEAAMTDYLLAANSSMSKMSIVADKASYRVGETIHVHIHMISGYRRPRTMGGDHIWVWMREKIKGAASCGQVTDHNNGTYSAALVAFWAGNPEIVASLVDPREAIRALYHVRRELPALWTPLGMFRAGHMNETTVCNPFPIANTSHSELCNLTSENSGMSFYCAKPRSGGLLCRDWEMVKTDMLWPKLPLTEAEDTMFALYVSSNSTYTYTYR
jgi:hypothetical protein